MEKFYESLKEHRLSQNISLEDISNKTKISIRFLSAIEEGNFKILPYTYIRLFLKAYCKEINADEGQALNALEKTIHSSMSSEGKKSQSTSEFEMQPSKQKVLTSDYKSFKKPRLRPLHGIILIAVIVFIIIIFQGLVNEREVKAPEPVASPVDTVRETNVFQEPDSIQVVPADSTENVSIPDTTVKEDYIAEPIQLQLITTDSVWIRIQVDHNEPKEYLFAPDRDVSWTANDQFRIRIGRPSAIKLFLNGQPLLYPQNSGTIPEFTITRDGLTR